MTKTKKWLIFSITIVFIIGLVLIWFNNKSDKQDFQKESVERGVIKKTVSITGSLISENFLSLSLESSGRIKDIKVSVGDQVLDGEVLVILENGILNEQVKKAEANLERVIMETNINDDSNREATKNVKNAKDYLEAAEDYHDQLVSAAEIAYQNAVDYFNDVETYYNQIVSDSGINSAETKSAKITLTSADNSKKNAEEALKTTKKNRQLNLISADNSLKVAKESLKTIESDYARGSRNALVQAAEADYQMALKNLENSTLKAPLNGIISKINYKKGEVIGSAGMGNSFGEMITKDFVLEADIPEANISEIKIKQKAEITFDAFDFDEKFEAEIIEIEPASTNIQGVIYYKTKLKILDSDSRFKEGMSADVDILIDNKEDVLKISNQFIFSEENKKFVYIMKNDSLMEREVQLGLNGDDGYVEIVSGLKEEEFVYWKE